MTLHYRVEIRGPLPEGLEDELHRRFGDFSQHREGGRTVLSELALDQAGLRSLLGLLWDVDSELHLVSTVEEEIVGEHR